MRKITTMVAALLIATTTFAQAPQGFSYQAVVRDAQNAVVANQTIEVTLTILQGATADSATAVFSEKHSAQTNANGLFTLTMGSVDATAFSKIDWAAGNVFLKTESRYGTATTQLLSVPFALYAAKAAEADVDLSGYYSKAEIDSLISALKAQIDGDAVDLGLTSGTLWATCNVGAINPWDYGNYYAWGETEIKDNYVWSTYKYCNGGWNSLTKYCNSASCGNGGFTDALITLELADDVAAAVIGSDYSMPTVADWNELSSQCYWVWTSNYNEHGVSGYIVYKVKSAGDKGTKVYSGDTPSTSYSLSDAHIFLPATGSRSNTGLSNAGSYGYYWSASLSLRDYDPYCAHSCNFGGYIVYQSGTSDRYCGLTVRPVRRR